MGLSPAIFPIPQMTYSTTSMWGELSNKIKWESTSFSIKLLTWSVEPDAMFVRHQAASN